jgi:hypothetical protein
MNRMFAIVEREMRKFFRSPMLMIMSLMMPILQLLIMGNAFGGKIVGARVAVVDYDHGPQAVKSARPSTPSPSTSRPSPPSSTPTRTGPRRRPHRQDRRRRHHSRAILAPRLCAGRAPHRLRRR